MSIAPLRWLKLLRFLITSMIFILERDKKNYNRIDITVYIFHVVSVSMF